MYGLLFVATLSRKVLISRQRLVAYGLCVCLGVLATALNGARASTPSLLLMVVMYTPFLFALPADAFGDRGPALPFAPFRTVSTLCAVAGIAHFTPNSCFLQTGCSTSRLTCRPGCAGRAATTP